MPRRAKRPTYYPSRGGYYTQVRRKQVLLAKGPEGDPEVYARALRAFQAIYAVEPATGLPTVRYVMEVWLAHVRAIRSPEYLKTRLHMLTELVGAIGETRADKLTPRAVLAWATSMGELRPDPRPGRPGKHRRWGRSMQRSALTAAVAAYNHAVELGILDRNPLAGLRKPSAPARRGTVTEAQHRRLIDYFGPGSFGDWLEALWATGARPDELASATSEELDHGIRALVLHRGKNYSKTGKPRVVYLGSAWERASSKTGFLFPGGKGKPLGRHSWGPRLRRAQERLNKLARDRGEPPPFPRLVSAYLYRHRFCTDWLRSGQPVGYLCQLLDTSPAMIARTYGHLGEHARDIAAALEKFQGGAG
jgi:integrase